MNTELPVAPRTIVVIGNGMVGHRFCESLLQSDQAGAFRLIVVGEESVPAYDRVHLTQYLSNDPANDLLLTSATWYEERGATLLLGRRVVRLSTDAKLLELDDGSTISFDVAVLATGSRPFVPPLPGTEVPGVFLYRTLKDLDAIRAASIDARSAAVIGGGLLGLEAAKALVDLGLPTAVVEMASRLMPRQLDDAGARLLTARVEALGVRTYLGVAPRRVVGDSRATGLELADGTEVPADVLVISAGIRPRDELARDAGIRCEARGGIAVDDHLESSTEGVFAIGECAAHRGVVYGLVGPGYAMADVLARRLTGDTSAEFVSADTSTRLKLLGVDVASFGDPFADERTNQSIIFHNHVRGVYQKLALSEDGSRLLGGMLVGDVSAFGRLVSATKGGHPLVDGAEALLFGDRAATGAPAILSDEETVCTCNNVTCGQILTAVRGGCATFAAVKKSTRAGSGCGGCSGHAAEIIQSELRRQGKSVKHGVCEHFEFSRQELFELVRVKGYATFEQVLNAHGKGSGCEICRPTIASILASIRNEFVLEHENIQDSNDRYLANIQKQGLYSVVPRIPGGEITPEKLLVIGRIAAKYKLYTKITGGQRIDLFGAKLDQLPQIWEELVTEGFESGHAYGKALRTVKSCVGSTWCRFGVSDSVSFAIRIENRYKGIRAPHKIKSAVSGCVRECAEVQSKDFGFIATESGWNVYVCGNGGAHPRHADLLASGVDDETAIRLVDRFIMFYIRTADRLMRTSKWIEQLEGGIARLRSVIVEDSLGICRELEESIQYLVDTYECEWKRVVMNPLLREKFRAFSNADEPEPAMDEARGQPQPVPWPKGDVMPELRRLPVVQSSWVPVALEREFPRDAGLTIRYGNAEIAVFWLASRNEWYATQARCPHKGDAVLGRGLVGDTEGEPKVACPLHKRTFALRSGQNLSGEGAGIVTFAAKAENGRVYVELPSIADVEFLLGNASACAESCQHVPSAAE